MVKIDTIDHTQPRSIHTSAVLADLLDLYHFMPHPLTEGEGGDASP